MAYELSSGSGRPSRSFVPRTTDSRHRFGFSPNRLLTFGLPTGPNQVWVSDITYMMLANGRWAYLVIWLDLWSRLVVGWHLDETMEDALIITAFRRAVLGRQPGPGLIAHSDRGGQCASKEFRRLLTRYGYQQSMSRVDDPNDNAFAEPYWSRLKAALMEEGAFLSLTDARLKIGESIDNYYDTVRLHSALGYLSLMQFEAQNKGWYCPAKPDHPTVRSSLCSLSTTKMTRLPAFFNSPTRSKSHYVTKYYIYIVVAYQNYCCSDKQFVLHLIYI